MPTSETPPEVISRTRSERVPTFRRWLFGALFLIAGVLLATITPPENLQDALEAQRAAVAENPTDSAQLNDLGNLLALAGQLEEAEEAYRQALQISPGSAVSLYNLALVLQEMNRSKEAREVLQTLLASDPNHAWAHYQLGNLFAAKKNRTKALRHFEIAFNLDRSLVDPKVNPHIVENRLVTEALLQLYVSKSPSTQAPRLYEQPGDVADLLLPAPQPDPVPGSEGADADRPSPRYRASFQPGTGATSAPDSRVESQETRTLDESSLRSSSGTSQPDRPATWSGTATSLRPGYPGSSATPEPSAATPTRPAAPTGAPTTFPQSTPEAAGEPGPFSPQLESTGRLEIEILPATGPDATVDAS